ncbi:hypothetical protein [Chengkuizengella sediminis]|uniref:hypothetical protein n=1 Tax=Chengkuizengella sediminis TaxID=1885917 RepID=UPI001389AB72|nr:hypothetical protein [Chengkuizengella sediminis]NDI33582.1 hypothetical protein [Chengkuizengella sediminis]
MKNEIVISVDFRFYIHITYEGYLRLLRMAKRFIIKPDPLRVFFDGFVGVSYFMS